MERLDANPVINKESTEVNEGAIEVNEMLTGSDGLWYIVHTYSSQEEKVKKNLEQRIQSLDMGHKIFGVVIPTEEETVIKEGKRRTERKKVFPGYILIQMQLDDESWYVVRNTPGVTGFVSAEDEQGRRSKPIPLDQAEVEAIMKQIQQGPGRLKVGFTVGQIVRINNGPFSDFIGNVEGIDVDKGKIRVLVSFFGRETPIELDFLQVAKV